MPADDTRLASGKSAAKNRVAQQRYRERQKGKLREYEQQVEVLSRRLTALEAENRSLGDRNRLLERLAQLVEDSGGGQGVAVRFCGLQLGRKCRRLQPKVKGRLKHLRWLPERRETRFEGLGH